MTAPTPTPELLTLARTIRALADQLPDTVYIQGPDGGCCYHPTPGNPHCCIVGAAVRAMRDEFVDDDLDGPEYGNTSAWDAVTRLLIGDPREVQHTDVDRLLLAWIDTVQGRQDDGASWSDAVRQTDHDYPGVL